LNAAVGFRLVRATKGQPHVPAACHFETNCLHWRKVDIRQHKTISEEEPGLPSHRPPPQDDANQRTIPN
jgi:hypothetical protein